MTLLAEVLLDFFVSAGLSIFAVAVTAAVYNNYSYKKTLSNVMAGILLGLFTLTFHFVSFKLNSVTVFDYRFLLLIVAGVTYNPLVLFVMTPFYLAGMALTYSAYSPALALMAAVFAIAYCIMISLLQFSKNLKSLLLLVGITPIVFSIPLITGRADAFDSKVIIMYAVAAAGFIAVSLLLFNVFMRRNTFGATTVSMYIESLFRSYGNIYHFTVNRDRTKIKFSKRMYDEFELTGKSLNEMEFSQFAKIFTTALAELDFDVPPEQAIFCDTLRDYIYITPKTSQRKYIKYLCRKNRFGYYSGQIKDVTSTIEPEEVLHTIMQKDHITGFKTYHLMKEDMVEESRANPGLMLQMHFMITFDQMMESLYGFELEKEYYRTMSEMLRREFPGAMFYSVKENEFQMLAFDIGLSDNAKNIAEKMSELFLRPCEIAGKRVSLSATIGVVVSEALKCDSIEKANILIDKAIFAKDMAFKRKMGSIYYFKESDYTEHIETMLRGELLPSLIFGGNISLVFQPIVSRQDAKVFGYEVFTRVKESSFTITTEQLIHDAYLFNLDRELDAAIIKAINERLKKERFRHHLFMNKLVNTHFTPEFREIAQSLARYEKNLFVEFAEFKEYDLEEFMEDVVDFTAGGIKIAIDDYGKAYSSQSLIANFSPSVIKIDMELIRGIDTNKRKQMMVKSIANYCDNLDIKCVAEGISCREEMLMCASLGVHFLQGFYLGKPQEFPRDIDDDIKKEILQAV